MNEKSEIDDLNAKVTELEIDLKCKSEALLCTIEKAHALLADAIDTLRNDTREAFKVIIVHETEMERNYILPAYIATHPKALDTLASAKKILGTSKEDSSDLYKLIAGDDIAERLDRLFERKGPGD